MENLSKTLQHLEAARAHKKAMDAQKALHAQALRLVTMESLWVEMQNEVERSHR